jgi:hypothetical protein
MTPCRHCRERPMRYVHLGLCGKCAVDPSLRHEFRDAFSDREPGCQTPPPLGTYKPCPHCMIRPMVGQSVCDECRALMPPNWVSMRREGTMPAMPTRALPATHEKLMVMRQRAERGEFCFHPADARDRDMDAGTDSLTAIFHPPRDFAAVGAANGRAALPT